MDINSSAHSVAELKKAEADVDTVYSKLDGILRKWRQERLKELADFKKDTVTVEEKIFAQDTKLQALLLDSNIALGTLMTKLRQVNPDLLLQPHDIPRQSRYNFADTCEVLGNNLSTTLRSQDFVTSKLLKQSPIPVVQPKHVGPVTDRKKTAGPQMTHKIIQGQADQTKVFSF